MAVIDDNLPPTTESGFLLHAGDWNEAVAHALARREGVLLSDAHWEILHFLREYHQRYHHLPTARMFVKAIQKTFGDTKGNSGYLHGLFPGSAVRLACMIAGLPKPPGCI